MARTGGNYTGPLISFIIHIRRHIHITYKWNLSFRKDKSTIREVASLLDELLTGIDDEELTKAVFLSFKNLFDTMHHTILLESI